MEVDSISVYTDGACKNNGKATAIAGIGVYFGENDLRNVSERIPGKQTNNAAELRAIIRACEIVQKDMETKVIHVHTDSEYAIKCATTYGSKLQAQQWKNKNKKIPNLELVKKLYILMSSFPNLHIHHVRAHTGRPDIHSVSNAHADRLANQAIENPSKIQKISETIPSHNESIFSRLTQLESRLQKIEHVLKM